MSSLLEVKYYRGLAEEKTALAELSSEWSLAEFWPYEEFLVSLRIPGTFLLYQAEDRRWVSMALGRALGGEVELFYIYVGQTARRRGLGAQLLREFCSLAQRDWTAERIFLEVRTSNHAAQALYKQQSFEPIALRKRYYKDGEDALIFEKVVRS